MNKFWKITTISPEGEAEEHNRVEKPQTFILPYIKDNYTIRIEKLTQEEFLETEQ